jgi:hypothetical protein
MKTKIQIKDSFQVSGLLSLLLVVDRLLKQWQAIG